MKPEVVFMLENADWPAMLVNAAGAVLRANPAAVKAFGPALEGASPLLSTLWSTGNSGTAEQFLAQWDRVPSAMAALKLRVRGGGMAEYSASVCSWAQDGQKLFLLQLLPGVPAPNRPVKTQSPDADAYHKQKLERALQLARSVALDFNNALTSVVGHTSLLLSKAGPDHPWRRSLQEVEKSAARAAEIASDLAVFSRQEKDGPREADADLNAVARRCVETFQSTGPGGITWKMRLERKLFAARFDEAKVQQALVKILENAIEALPGPGQITVQSRNVELAAPTQDQNARLAAGTYVCVEICDTGKGVPADVLPRIFEPFFTTKGSEHRGLGLVFVYGLVSNHGGAVAVSSQPGAGTAVRVYLPALKTFVKGSDGANDNLRGGETILIVDDEDLLLTLGETVLHDYGYRVLTANSGQKALDLLARTGKPVDLLITDLVMPAMSGRELVAHVRRLSPATRILCTSGYVRPGNAPDSEAYLQKPFTTRELLVKVRQALGN